MERPKTTYNHLKKLNNLFHVRDMLSSRLISDIYTLF